MKIDTTYNGWTNYATWRVNLEVFDGNDQSTWSGFPSAYDLGHALKDYTEDLVYQMSSEGIARDYALAFLSDVNWHEIAEHIFADLAEDSDDTYDEFGVNTKNTFNTAPQS